MVCGCAASCLAARKGKGGVEKDGDVHGGIGMKTVIREVRGGRARCGRGRARVAVNGIVMLLGDAFGVLDKANWQTQRAQRR